MRFEEMDKRERPVSVEDQKQPVSESTSCTMVICHGDKTKKALYEILDRMSCSVCEVTSLNDLLTYLENSKYTYIRFSENNPEGPLESYSLQSSRTEHLDGIKDTRQRPQPRAAESLVFTRSTDHMSLYDIEEVHIRNTLIRCRWKFKTAARELGIDRTTLYRKMKRFGIDREIESKEEE
jgi:transcriptional regulator of acetoin/glycerol metabolism